MPKRLNIVFDDELHLYKINGNHVVSVTQILDKTVPKQLSYWGYRLGLGAARHLIETTSWPALQAMDAYEMEQAIAQQERETKGLNLTPNKAREERADEGTAIHQAIEIYHETGELPSLTDFDYDMRGFIQAFSQFVLEQDPEVEASELIVAHGELNYAGRPDLIASFGERGRGLIDFKTSRRIKRLKRGPEPVFEVYESMHAQLRLYEEAWLWTENFHGKTVERPAFRAICYLHDSGKYALIPGSPAEWALLLPAVWYGMRDDGQFKAPWETDPERRKRGLAQTNATPPK